MNLLKLSLLFAFLLTSTPSLMAHSNHHHSKSEIKDDKVPYMAKVYIKKLIEKKKLDPSWEKAEVKSHVKKKYKKRWEWVVIAENSKSQDPKKRILYLFISIYGDYIAANFTGK